MTKKIIKRLETLFFKRLDKQTGWGKEQVKKEFREALIKLEDEDRG